MNACIVAWWAMIIDQKHFNGMKRKAFFCYVVQKKTPNVLSVAYIPSLKEKAHPECES